MDIPSYLLGKKAGGGTPVSLQTKNVTVTSNGESTINPGDGYDGLTKVNLTTNVQPNLETLTETISTNTTTTFTPTTGKDGFSSVSITTNVPTGGAVEEKDVNFYDYDGTLLHSYTAQEFAALDSMPENPTHDGLTAQGWNWTFQEAQDYVEDTGFCNIGQMYIPSDGSTRIYIHLEDGRLSPYLGFAINGTATVDWGDGSAPQDITGTSTGTVISTQHTYSTAGDYTISINSESTIYLLGNSSSGGTQILWNNETASISTNHVYRNAIKKIELGNANIGSYAFNGCYSLKNLTTSLNTTGTCAFAFARCYVVECFVIPRGIISLGNNIFTSTYHLETIILPGNFTTIGSNASFGGSKIKTIVIPNGVSSIPGYAFDSCDNLKKIILPSSITYIGGNALNGCTSLSSIKLPSNINNVGSAAIQACSSLSNIKVPSRLTSIVSGVFGNNRSMGYYDFSEHTVIPSISSNSFTNIPADCKIIVPDNLYETWIASGNWPTYSSNIIKKSDWDALQNA